MSYEQDRVNKAEKMRQLGFDPFGKFPGEDVVGNFSPMAKIYSLCFPSKTMGIGQFIAELEKSKQFPYWDTEEPKKQEVRKDITADNGPEASGFGRIVLRRDMGNLHFLTIRDHSGDCQIALSKKKLTEKEWGLAKLLDLGDIITFAGRVAPTQKEEPTLWATSLNITVKSLTPPPAKFEGLVDVELRFRRRYTDLWSNPKSLQIAQMRSFIIGCLRSYLEGEDFLEVETPILQTQAGGAAAKPFITHHNALGTDLFMRIAPELYLKQLLVGGIPRVFEIGRNFRNEGISPKHNPEFTALELYHVYSDYLDIAAFAQDMINSVIDKITPSVYQNGKQWERLFTIRQNEWRKATVKELVDEHLNNYLRECHAQGEMPTIRLYTPQDYHEYYLQHVEKTIKQPTFVTGLPASAVPLAKSDGEYALAWELIADGKEIGCGYTEQNDPAAQRAAFQKQKDDALSQHLKGNFEPRPENPDEDFLDALAVGMPPTGGMGIGIDRLVMWLLNIDSIREVILFPTMKPDGTKPMENPFPPASNVEVPKYPEVVTKYVIQEFFVGQWEDMKVDQFGGARYTVNEELAKSAYRTIRNTYYRDTRLMVRKESVIAEGKETNEND